MENAFNKDSKNVLRKCGTWGTWAPEKKIRIKIYDNCDLLVIYQ